MSRLIFSVCFFSFIPFVHRVDTIYSYTCLKDTCIKQSHAFKVAVSLCFLFCVLRWHYIAINMDPGQTAPFGADETVFIVFAPMI